MVRSWLRYRLRASCWVMVLAPWLARPCVRSVTTARAMPMGSKPEWLQNRRSSMATTAAGT